MDVEMAAAIASCLMGAVMVGAVLMYAGMHQLITEAYEEGRRDSLRRASTPGTAADERTVPAPAAAPPTTSAA